MVEVHDTRNSAKSRPGAQRRASVQAPTHPRWNRTALDTESWGASDGSAPDQGPRAGEGRSDDVVGDQKHRDPRPRRGGVQVRVRPTPTNTGDVARAQTPRRRQQRGDLARRCRHRMGVDHAVRPAHRLLRQGDAIGVCRQQAHRRQVPDRNQGRRSASSWSPRPAGSDRAAAGSSRTWRG